MLVLPHITYTELRFITHARSGMSQGLPSVFFLCVCVTLVHANICMHILVSNFQDGGKPFPVTRLPAA